MSRHACFILLLALTGFAGALMVLIVAAISKTGSLPPLATFILSGAGMVYIGALIPLWKRVSESSRQ